MSQTNTSPVVNVYRALGALNSSWVVDIGRPEAVGWIAGEGFRTAARRPFGALLGRIGERVRTSDRRTVAALFALRFGWASAMAIGPFLGERCVPDVGLDNISLKFQDSTFFERAAIHVPRGTMIASDPRARHPSITAVADGELLLRSLRTCLVEQASPVVRALHEWSGFAPAGTWGMLTSSWAAHFVTLGGDPKDQRTILPTLDAFFAGDDPASRFRPRLHAVTCEGTTHVYQRRASCCRWYLLPKGELCASCPLVSHEERVARNLAWMKRQREALPSIGHT